MARPTIHEDCWTGERAKPLQRHHHRPQPAYRLLDRHPQRLDRLLIHVAKKLERQMDRGRLSPGNARASLQFRLNSTFQFLLENGECGQEAVR